MCPWDRSVYPFSYLIILTINPASSSTTVQTTTASSTTLKTSTTTSSTASTTTTAVSTGTFSKTSGTLFNIDGVTKYYAGTNSYWIGFLTDNADVDLVMSHLQSSGLKILRVWGFNDVTSIPSSGTVYYQYLSSSGSTINTGADGLERLDYVVQSAAAHDIKLIINFVNNWSDYGGMAAYVTVFGGSQTTWYTNTDAQTQYQAYIAAVVARYKTSTAVFAWELANEPRCTGCDSSIIYDWAKSTSAYIKSLDSNHMVTIGDEGFDPSVGDGSYPYSISAGGYSFSANLNISTLDFGTFHMYPDSWGVSDGQWALDWISAHGAVCVAANKPCLLEEYGVTYNHTQIEAPWQTQALDTAGVAGDMFWQLGDTLSTGETSDDGNTIYYGSSDWTVLVTDHIEAINASGKK